MKIVTYLLAAILAALGFIFLIGAQDSPVRPLIGVVLLVAAGAVVYLFRAKPQVTQNTVVQTDRPQRRRQPGDHEVQGVRRAAKPRTRWTSRPARSSSACPNCGATYQIEEEPKW
jgi:hypothetical protein